MWPPVAPQTTIINVLLIFSFVLFFLHPLKGLERGWLPRARTCGRSFFFLFLAITTPTLGVVFPRPLSYPVFPSPIEVPNILSQPKPGHSIINKPRRKRKAWSRKSVSSLECGADVHER